MEQHPVPQNVTTFQFRLIGDMTIKQFGYLCGGSILAFIAYKLPLPFIITWPAAFAFAFLGVGFAFIPVEERPMDVWVFSFFKSVYTPTQFIWIKEAQKSATAKPVAAQTVTPPPVATTKSVPAPATTKAVLSDIFQPPPAKPIPSPEARLTVKPNHHWSIVDWLADLWNPKGSVHMTTVLQQQPSLASRVTGTKPIQTAPATPVQHAPAPVSHTEPAVHQKMESLEASVKELQEQLKIKNVTTERVLELQQQLTDVLKQKTSMEDELVGLKRQMLSRDSQKSTTSSPLSGDIPPAAPSAPSTVRVINTQDAATKVGLPRLTNVANVITGLAKDDAGNQLPGILVTVTNGEGIPVRALKTNKLGQFAASTPLGSGTYFVEIEDPRGRFTFSRVQITLNGSVVPALEIIAKSQKQLTREILTQEIFGKNTM